MERVLDIQKTSQTTFSRHRDLHVIFLFRDYTKGVSNDAKNLCAILLFLYAYFQRWDQMHCSPSKILCFMKKELYISHQDWALSSTTAGRWKKISSGYSSSYRCAAHKFYNQTAIPTPGLLCWQKNLSWVLPSLCVRWNGQLQGSDRGESRWIIHLRKTQKCLRSARDF